MAYLNMQCDECTGNSDNYFIVLNVWLFLQCYVYTEENPKC